MCMDIPKSDMVDSLHLAVAVWPLRVRTTTGKRIFESDPNRAMTYSEAVLCLPPDPGGFPCAVPEPLLSSVSRWPRSS